MLFAMRFDFRNPPMAGTAMAERYAAALDMAAWADGLGCVNIAISEHHGSSDGYLPSPLTMVAAMAARTSTVRFSIAALIAPFYDPLRLAEDLLVLDNLSKGRVDLIVAGGYVREEFAMFGVPTSERAARVTEVVDVIRAAFAGDPFEYRGRTVRLMPEPYRPGGAVNITLGGSSEPAARRAARIGDGFVPSVPEVWDFYRDEMVALGKPDPGPYGLGENRVVALAVDADEGWRQMSPFFLHETNTYGEWQSQENVVATFREAGDAAELRARGQYDVLTPGAYVRELKDASFPFALLHPLCGGMPIDLAWDSLRLFETDVMPAFS
jgi:alkanesulfonate monooxygenase SsuD/methylene tetrahydromethanopterin reductase-like flavin-dependent oxidoreductase (luciferase family)